MKPPVIKNLRGITEFYITEKQKEKKKKSRKKPKTVNTQTLSFSVKTKQHATIKTQHIQMVLNTIKRPLIL